MVSAYERHVKIISTSFLCRDLKWILRFGPGRCFVYTLLLSDYPFFFLQVRISELVMAFFLPEPPGGGELDRVAPSPPRT